MTSTGFLLVAERVPNEDAIALSPTVGWLLLACVVCLGLIFILQHEHWRRLWLRMEDPRPMAAFRILFGLCTMCNINGLWEHFIYLFTDEGIFLTDVVRHVFARQQFEGFGNGLGDDPYGFFDFDGVIQFLKGPKYSLLFFWDSPTAWWIHWAAFQLSIGLMIIGLWTRYTKWIAWFLFHSIIVRNHLYWEGTENVFRTFFFYLVVSRCDRAYSVDNWLRCRKLRKLGRLSERGGPGNGTGVAPSDEHPNGLEAVYRLIPAWPRLLVMLQLGALYCYTGAVKNGPVWMNGDAFYYALNLDHFYRFPPQELSAVLGTNLFRINTHVTHWWEVFFPVVIFGLIVRFALAEPVPPLRGFRKRLAQGLWIALGLGCLAIVEVVYPVHYRQPKSGMWTLERAQWAFAAAWLTGMGLVGWAWHRLRHRPFRLVIRKRELVIDLKWFCSWIIGRRLIISLGIIFHSHLIFMMNIGWFTPGALSGYVCFLNGGELAFILAAAGRRLGKYGGPLVPEHIKKGEPPLAAEDPTLPHLHRDNVKLPQASMIIALALTVLGVVLAYREILHFGWSAVGIAAFLAGSMVREGMARGRKQLVILPRTGDVPASDHPPLKRPWAYGPFGRFVINSIVVYHIIGVAAWLMPDKDSLSAFRAKTHDVFRWWLRTTQTTQGWKMFAPNPPRSNLFMRVLVTDLEGQTWDLNTDVYHPSQRPIPWIWYSRQRKMNRRIIGGEGGKGSWYQKWHARYICRQWALDHEGVPPAKVDLVKITYPIPKPSFVAKNGPYDPVERLKTHGNEKYMLTAECEKEVGAQVPNVIRERHGLEPQDKGIRRWNILRNKKRRWERKQEKKRKEKEEQNDEAKQDGKQEKG